MEAMGMNEIYTEVINRLKEGVELNIKELHI